MKTSGPTWKIRLRQSLITAALGIPLLVAVVMAPPFAAEPRAAAVTHMLGPAAPITAGTDNIVPIRSGNTVSYPTRWACGDTTSDVLTLSNPDGSGRFQTVSRDLGSLHQTLTVTALANGSPRQFVLNETRGGVLVHSTTITLVDLNGDGVFDAATFTGQYNATISFVENGDYVSIPWSQASTLGIQTNYSCAGALPQLWIPLADTNGDGRGDSVVFDLDGNGVPDADLYAGPPLVVAAVPTMGPIARLMLILLLGGTGAWYLSRRRGPTTGTPA